MGVVPSMGPGPGHPVTVQQEGGAVLGDGVARANAGHPPAQEGAG